MSINNGEPDNQHHELREPLIQPESANITPKRSRGVVSRTFLFLFKIYTDQSGSAYNVASGLFIALLLGTILGLNLPKNTELPTVWYRGICSIIGYTYFFCWSISFYPQLMINISRKSVIGLSTDASIMQLLNFASYAAYCSFFFFDEDIRQEYRDRHGVGSEIMVSSSDVAFSLHAFALTLVMISQIAYYGGYKTKPISFVTKYISLSILLMCAIYSAFVLFGVAGFLWIDFLYILAMVKLVLTVATYIPQLVLNCQRKSTLGFNIWNIILDFSGGGLSLLQLVLDGYDLGNVAGAVQGNWAKCLLSLISLCFDAIFFIQHFILYNKRPVSLDDNTSERIRMV